MDRTSWLLLGLRIFVVISVAMGVPHFPDPVATRFHEIANTPGVPYRDFQVEYPIGELVVIQLTAWSTTDVTRVLLGLLAFGADLVAFAALLVARGGRAARTYLVLGSPLLIFIYRRADLVVVALVALGLAFADRGRSRWAGTWIAGGTLVKLWPVVLLPALIIRRQLRGVGAFLLVTASGVAGWFLLGGLEGIGQVTTFRGATGWELESTVGAIVWAVTGEHRFEQGANRTGTVPGWADVAMVVVLIAGLAAVWLRARRASHDPAGAPALAAVGTLLVLSPLLSPHFVSWLLPMGAIASLEHPRWFWLTWLPLLITGGIVASWFLDLHLGPGWNQTLLIVRNATLLAIPLAWLFTGGSSTDRQDGSAIGAAPLS